MYLYVTESCQMIKHITTMLKKKIDDLKQTILENYEIADKDIVSSDWLQMIIDRFHHPEVSPKKKSK